MTVLLTLTTAGIDTGPFNLFSNIDGFNIPFETNVNKIALQSGYLSSLVPDTATIVRIKSAGNCTNFVDISLVPLTSSTSSTSSTSTTSSTTLVPPTTTTTTTVIFNYVLSNGVSTPGAACALNVSINNVQSSTSPPLIMGSILYFTGTTIRFAGGGNYFRVIGQPYVVQINGTGVILSVISCS